MNCFNDRDRPAIGLCKSCAKALCADCLTELPNGLACKGACEDRVNLLNRIVNRNSQLVTAAQHQIRHSGIVVLLLGLGFLFFAVVAFAEFDNSFVPYLLGFMGAVLLVGAVLRLGGKEQLPKPDKQKS